VFVFLVTEAITSSSCRRPVTRYPPRGHTLTQRKKRKRNAQYSPSCILIFLQSVHLHLDEVSAWNHNRHVCWTTPLAYSLLFNIFSMGCFCCCCQKSKSLFRCVLSSVSLSTEARVPALGRKTIVIDTRVYFHLEVLCVGSVCRT
jgi:hypothetical protein